MKNLILASTSTLYGENYLEYLRSTLIDLYKDVNQIIFIPYARPGGKSHDDYTFIVSEFFKTLNKKIIGIHQFKNPLEAFEKDIGIFAGGGNTFVLVDKLYRFKLINPLIKAINSGTPYLGTSAGSNICGLTMQTSNDMPIVYPPSFKTLGIVPFNLNPHFIDPDSNSVHMGETREQRIKEFHSFNSQPVIGLREGSWLKINNTAIQLQGPLNARVFEYKKAPYELVTGSFLNTLN